MHLERKTMTFIRFKTKYGGHSKFHRNLNQYAHQALEDLRRPPSDLFQQSTPADTELSFAQNLLETLYPHTPQAPFIGSTASSQPNDSPFSSRELRKVIRELNKTKAPSYDGLDNIILQQIHSANPQLLLEMFNKCLSLGLFPTSFKMGVILLFYKEGKDQNDPKSYRPISLLPSMGKLLEKLMTQRLTSSSKRSGKSVQSNLTLKREFQLTMLLTPFLP
ncbi:hypothetical protein AVEN_204814-1 [Araneus ventricosus]|uniref:Reverse transcriptase domain-containing protein n=1 Tax=Araneus ventricosus TaxID=182803 RepID=A0A4Y2QW71_ARAVE|nr:hypothetical protein AVEN_204814-1 [Araneus ventricosus]